MGLDISLVPEQTGQHKLGTVADSVNSGIFHNEALVCAQKALQRLDNLAEEGLVSTVIVLPLGIQDIVKGDHLSVGLRHDTTANSAEFLHMGADSEEQTKMDTECSDIGTGLARNPEDTEVAVIVELDELALVNGADTELALDGRDQGGALEQGACEGLKGRGKGSLAASNLVMETDNATVLLTSSLLGLDESGGAVDADN